MKSPLLRYSPAHPPFACPLYNSACLIAIFDRVACGAYKNLVHAYFCAFLLALFLLDTAMFLASDPFGLDGGDGGSENELNMGTGDGDRSGRRSDSVHTVFRDSHVCCWRPFPPVLAGGRNFLCLDRGCLCRGILLPRASEQK